jgi:hypothetical protein
MKPEDIVPDFVEWPERWMYVREDVAYGKDLLPPMNAFIVDLISKGLTRKTIRRHIDNLWLLGGEIIRHVNTYEEYHIPPIEKLKKSIGSDGGPYCRHIDSEAELASFDSTCRKLHRFLEFEDVKQPTIRSTGRAKKLRPG